MSIVSNVIQKLGIIGLHLPKIDDLGLGFIRAVPWNMRLGRSKAWAWPRAAEEFQRNQIATKALAESMARLPLAR